MPELKQSTIEAAYIGMRNARWSSDPLWQPRRALQAALEEGGIVLAEVAVGSRRRHRELIEEANVSLEQAHQELNRRLAVEAAAREVVRYGWTPSSIGPARYAALKHLRAVLDD